MATAEREVEEQPPITHRYDETPEEYRLRAIFAYASGLPGFGHD